MTGKVAGASAAVVAGVLLLGACGWNLTTDAFSDESEVDGRVAAVRFAADSGNVRIHAGDRVLVRRSVHYHEERPGATHRMDGDTLVLDACPVRDCWIDYDVTVPDGVLVSGRTDSGDVEVTGAGGVDVAVASGNVTVDHTSGSVTVAASSGEVTVRGASEAINVEANSGDVVINDAEDAVTVRADSGDVSVTVPQGVYRVRAVADSGDIGIDVEEDDAAGTAVDLESDSGDINVTYSES